MMTTLPVEARSEDRWNAVLAVNPEVYPGKESLDYLSADSRERIARVAQACFSTRRAKHCRKNDSDE